MLSANKTIPEKCFPAHCVRPSNRQLYPSKTQGYLSINFTPRNSATSSLLDAVRSAINLIAKFLLVAFLYFAIASCLLITEKFIFYSSTRKTSAYCKPNSTAFWWSSWYTSMQFPLMPLPVSCAMYFVPLISNSDP